MIELIELFAARREEFESLVVSRVPIEVLKAHSQQTLELIQEKKRIGFSDAEKAELRELWNKELCSCGKAYGDHTQDEMRAGFDRDKINGIEDQGIIPDSAGNGTSGQTPEQIAARRAPEHPDMA